MTTESGGNAWSYESVSSAGVWRIHDIEGLFTEEIDEAEQHFLKEAGKPEIGAAVVVFEDDANLSSEVQDHMNEAWSNLARAVDLDRVAYVADGIRAMAVKANVEAPETEIEAFRQESDAVEWAVGPADRIDA